MEKKDLNVQRATYILVLGNNVVEQLRVDLGVVPLLREMDSIHLSCLDLLRDVVRVDLITHFSTPRK